MARLKPDAREELVRERRTQLLEAALALIAERGFDRTSVDDIARAAGVAKGTVYLYFPTKEAVLEALFDAQSLVPEVTPVLGDLGPSPPIDKVVHTLVPILWRGLKTRKQALTVLLSEAPARPEYGKRLLQHVMPLSEILADRLRAALSARGSPRETGAKAQEQPRIDTLVAVRALVATVLGLFVEQELLNGKAIIPLSDDRITETVASIFLYGIMGSQPRSDARSRNRTPATKR